MLSEFEKQILKANQLILRDRIWNDSEIRSQAKITDENITELLKPSKEESESEDLKKEQAKEIEVEREPSKNKCSRCARYTLSDEEASLCEECDDEMGKEEDALTEVAE